jgi:hypothetical protein
MRKDFTGRTGELSEGELIFYRNYYLRMLDDYPDSRNFNRLYWAAEGELLRRSLSPKDNNGSDNYSYTKHS